MGRVRLTGHIDVTDDRLQAVRRALPEHKRLTLAEPDCLSFEVTESLSTKGRFNVCETFVSHEGFEHHQSRTAASDWANITKELQRHYSIEVLDK